MESGRVRFPSAGKEKKCEKLELVHTNVWELAQASYLGNSTFHVTFTDDETRKTWVYCIYKMSNVFDTFKTHKGLVENETRNKLKCLIIDNGGE